MRRHILLSAIFIFLLGVIPPSLGLYSYFRVDDFTGVMLAKTQFSTFSLESFRNIFLQPLYEYYRPSGLAFWWLAYLLGGINPAVYHAIASVLFGLICVNIYFIGRFHSTELSGWLASLCFMTFAPVVVVSWWISNFGVGFGGMLFYTFGVLAFIYLSKSPRTLTLVSLFCFLWAFFAKNSFVFLSPLPLVLFLFNKRLRSRGRLFVSVSTVMLSGLSVLVSRIMLGDVGANRHVHLNIFELPPEMIIQNLSDYWSLLVYGHSPFIVILGFIYGIHSIENRILRMFGLPVLFVLVALMLQWPPGMMILALAVLCITVIMSDWQGRVWGFWMAAGLAQTVFWDVRIVGWLLNRFILESSVGFALFLGHGLAVYAPVVASSVGRFYRERRWISSSIIMPISLSLFLLSTVYTCRSYIYPTFIRDLDMTYHVSYMIRDTLHYIVPTLPAGAHLLVEEPLVDGVEHSSQFDDALTDHNRTDIQAIYYEQSQLHATIHNLPVQAQTVYLISKRLIHDALPADFIISQQHEIKYGRYEAWIYHIDRRPAEQKS